MSFNSDPSKQPEDVIFSQKVMKMTHLPLFLKNIQVLQFSS